MMTTVDADPGSPPIFLYGTGSAAKYIFDCLKRREIAVSGFIDTHNSGEFLGLPVFSLDDFSGRDLSDVRVILASSFEQEIYEEIERRGVSLTLNRWIDSFGVIAPIIYKAKQSHPPIEASNEIAYETPYIETIITKSCNLHCDGCQNYTNYSFKGMMDFDDLAHDIRRWGARVKPAMYRILGGEPLLHPRLPDFIRLGAEVWPDANRFVVTNGLLAARREDIVPALVETDTAIELSIHSNDPKYLARLRPAIRALKAWAAQSVRFTISDSREFIRTYRGVGRGMRPFNHDPVKAWEICTAKNCKNIIDSRLWKCPTISMLRDVLHKFGLENNPDWAQYLKYQGLPLDASDEELAEFVSRGPEEICSICPAERPTYQKDVFNLEFERNVEQVEVNYPVIDIHEFLNAC